MTHFNWKLAFVGIGFLSLINGCGGSAPSPKSPSPIKPTADASASVTTRKPNSGQKDAVGVDSGLYYPVGPLAARIISRRDDFGGPISWPPVSEWGLKETAADALARIGPEAVPYLIRALQDSNDQVRLQAVRALGRIGPEASPAVAALTERLTDANPLVRQNAARALGQIGPAAKDAVPQLIRALQPEQK